MVPTCRTSRYAIRNRPKSIIYRDQAHALADEVIE